MTSKTDFTSEEWTTLRAVFCAIVLDVAIADHTFDDAEAKAWHTEVDVLSKSALPLVRDVLQLGSGRCIDDAVVDKAARTPLADLLNEAGAILKAHATPEEIEDYKRSLRSLAVAVAESTPGGDKEENQMLVTLNDLLWSW